MILALISEVYRVDSKQKVKIRCEKFGEKEILTVI